jgi:NCS1 family nucleobase:cation symporter-1
MFISTATTAAATNVLGKSYWNVWDLCKLNR